ncbi:MAG TPA: ABC transporter substrate-binding protein [Acidimicrobiales bacterium]|nr:ABC transporter substrate-binding protein [Acidimicrobiales bacterium]
MNSSALIHAILDGVLTGSVYALMATGLTLIFGVMDIINVAQGILVILGAYLSYTLSVHFGIDLFAGLVITIPTLFVVGIVVERLFIARLKGPERTAMSILVTYAISLIIEGALNMIYSINIVQLSAWYGSATTPGSRAMVAAYDKKYGGTPATISADVAEAYSVGQVIDQAVTATKGFDNSKIIAYLHSGVSLTTVQGHVKFDKLGENNSATAFTFQWQGNNFVQVNPTSSAASKPVLFPKPVWGK